MKKRWTEEVTNRKHGNSSSIFVFDTLPLIYPTNHSTIVTQLKQLGVANISVTIAKQKQSFAGRLKLFKDKICPDLWVLHAIRGYQIDWLNHLYQRSNCHCPHFSQEETESLEKEVYQMLEKKTTSQVTLLFNFFLFLNSCCGCSKEETS